jgi:WD40 repeat protein
LEIVDLKSRKEVAHADVLDSEPDRLATAHFIAYSSDQRYLLLATEGSDVLSIFDAITLKLLKRIVLHPKKDFHVAPGQVHYFRGIVNIAVAANGDIFGVLTHDELQDNEVFVGLFSSGRLIKNWSLGRGRTGTELGQTSLSLSEDGARIAVPVLPYGDDLPKDFNNLRLYDSGSAQMVKSIRTNGLVGQVMLLPDGKVLASRIDTPRLFSKKTCIERWDMDKESLNSQFCDQGRDVSVAMTASLTADHVVGFACHMHKSIEGIVSVISGRLDVWDMKSGAIIASSDEIPHLISHLQVSTNGEWMMADQILFQISTAP